MLFRPSNISDLTSCSASPAGVGGFSRTVAMKNAEATTEAIPVTSSIVFIP